MINLNKFIQLLKINNIFLLKTFKSIKNSYYNIKIISDKNFKILGTNIGFNFLLNNSSLDSQNFLENSLFNKVMLLVEYIKVQELTFLAEYYLITTLFCLTLFALFSFKLITNEKHFLIKFQYNNQLIFLLIFGLVCYLILVYQQFNISLLTFTSFNDTIYNDHLSVIAKLIIGISSVIYLIFITQYLKDQKLNNFEYYIIILTSIFGFFLLCGANDLITAYLAIELQGLAFYVLASFKKSSNFSIESGVKYFVLGSLSTAIFLLGVTFIYGFSGSVLLTDFKDFFIWVFSTNSAVLSLESIFEIFNSFQEKIDSNSSSSCLNLKVVSDKFDLLKTDSVMPFENAILFYLINNLEAVDDVVTFCEILCCFQMFSELELIDINSLLYPNDIYKDVSHAFFRININSLSNLFLNSEIVSDGYFITDISFVVSGMLIILLALFFKLALAPFHLWSPDVYEGSPSSSTFFFMIISKFSLFVFLLRLCYSSFYSLISYWQFYSLLIATVSIFVGAVAGLKQRKLKSLLTYSSINNMGFVLLAFSIGGFEGIQMKFYYLIVYILAGLCIWAIILNLKLHKKMYFEKQNRDIGDLALLQESNNIVAQSLGITLFSMAGLPPMVGFLAKMGVFKALSGVSIYFFSFVNILFSVIATFYYIRIVKIIFFENILIGNLYATINTKKIFIINLLTFLLVFLFMSPMFLYFYSYKITLFLNKSFY